MRQKESKIYKIHLTQNVSGGFYIFDLFLIRSIVLQIYLIAAKNSHKSRLLTLFS